MLLKTLHNILLAMENGQCRVEVHRLPHPEGPSFSSHHRWQLFSSPSLRSNQGKVKKWRIKLWIGGQRRKKIWKFLKARVFIRETPNLPPIYTLKDDVITKITSSLNWGIMMSPYSNQTVALVSTNISCLDGNYLLTAHADRMHDVTANISVQWLH